MKISSCFFILGLVLALGSAGEFTIMSLEQLDSFDTANLDCSRTSQEFLQIENSMRQWQDILAHQDYINDDLSTLLEIQNIIQKKKGNIHDQLEIKLNKLKLPQTNSQIGLSQVNSLKKECKNLLHGDDHEECCQTLLKLTGYLISQLTNVRNQCQQSPLTVIKIKGHIKDMEMIRASCGGQEVTKIISEDEKSQSKDPQDKGVVKNENEDQESESKSGQGEVDSEDEHAKKEGEEGTQDVDTNDQENEQEDNEEGEDQEEEAEEVQEQNNDDQEDNNDDNEDDNKDGSGDDNNEVDNQDDNQESGNDDQENEAQGEEKEDGQDDQQEDAKESSNEDTKEDDNTQDNQKSNQAQEDDDEDELMARSSFQDDQEQDSEANDNAKEEGKFESNQVQQKACYVSGDEILTVSSKADQPVFTQKMEATTNNFGFSFYFRWLSRFPEVLPKGVATLGNAHVASFGDDKLALYILPTGLNFVSVDSTGKVSESLSAATNIEGVWGLVYMAASENDVFGYIQFGGGVTNRIQLNSIVKNTGPVVFKVGGKNKLVPSFQGQVSRISTFVMANHIYTAVVDFQEFVAKCYNAPASHNTKSERLTVAYGDGQTYSKSQVFDNNKAYTNDKLSFVGEYSASGWFKMTLPINTPFSSGFRLTTNDLETNKNYQVLGDRNLYLLFREANSAAPEIILCTYSVDNQNGEGNANVRQVYQPGNQLTKWYFVYQGYSEAQKTVFSYIKMAQGEKILKFQDIRHYFANKYYFYLGQDKFVASYNGAIQNFKINFYKGSYITTGFDETFGFIVPSQTSLDGRAETQQEVHEEVTEEVHEEVTEESHEVHEEITEESHEVHEVHEEVTEESHEVHEEVSQEFRVESNQVQQKACYVSGDEILTVSSKADQPVFTQKMEATTNNFGFSFYFRWLSRFPEVLPKGVATLGNAHVASFGDDKLALYILPTGLNFVSVDSTGKVSETLSAATNIEGVWGLVYMAASENDVFGYIQFGGGVTNRIQLNSIVKNTGPVVFKVGGKNKLVPSFQGQVSRISTFVMANHIYTAVVDFQEFVAKCYNAPASHNTKSERLTVAYGDGQTYSKSQVFDNNKAYTNDKLSFVGEYSASGWFKMTLPINTPFSSGFRLTTNDLETNKNYQVLGDRNLYLLFREANSAAPEIILCTYSVDNQNGEGNANVRQVYQPGNQLTKWYFVYQGYSEAQKTVFSYIKMAQGEKILKFQDIRHYFANKYYFYLGQDKFVASYNGAIQNFKINFYKGSYITTGFDETFGFIVPSQTSLDGRAETQQEVHEEVTEEVHEEVTEESHEVHEEITEESHEEVTEESHEVHEEVTEESYEVHEEVSQEFRVESNQVQQKACYESGDEILTVSSKADQPVFTQKMEATTNNFGFSFYFRWLSRFPEVLPKGVATLGNAHVASFGDDKLALYILPTGLNFVSVDSTGKVSETLSAATNIEGVWGLVYMAASENDVFGYIQFGGGVTNRIQLNSIVKNTGPVVFKVGGKNKLVPSFQGQVSRISTFVMANHIYTAVVDFQEFVAKCYNAPASHNTKSERLTVAYGDGQTYSKSQVFDNNKAYTNDKLSFVGEYSASGWFKMTLPINTPFSSGFRLTTNDLETNKNYQVLGDRNLYLLFREANSAAPEIILCTYTVDNQNGEGNANVRQVYQPGNQLTKWYFVYQGYSEAQKTVFSYIKMAQGEKILNFQDIRHYFANKYYFYLGQDKFVASYNGAIQNFKINFYKGSYITTGFDETFGFSTQPPALFIHQSIDEIKQEDDNVDNNIEEEHQVATKDCGELFEVKVDNVADIMCALSNYLEQAAQGNDPALDPNGQKFCFCLTYESDNTNPELLQLAQTFGGFIKPRKQTQIQKMLAKQVTQRKI